jgi:hypothetical protein
MADQRFAPEATTRRASAIATSDVGRVACTTNASGMRYCGVGAADDFRRDAGRPALEALLGGAVEDATGVEGRPASPPDA